MARAGLEEKLPGGILLATVEKVAAHVRKASVWSAYFGLACCAMEVMNAGGPPHDLARFGMGKAPAAAAGRPDDRSGTGQPEDGPRAPADLRPDGRAQMGHLDGACASRGGMVSNYAIVQGVDHIVPVDIYLPGRPPRPEMLLDALLKLHDKIQNSKLGANRDKQVNDLEQAQLRRLSLAARWR